MIDLQSLTTLLDDQTLLRKYLDRFAIDMPALLKQIEAAATEENWEQLHLHAHTFRTQLQYLNITSAIAIAAALEQMSTTARPDKHAIEHMITQLSDLLIDILAEIRLING
jgi:HPt (histidine-containing phosphotransfer) domain-containing protein